MVRCPRTWPSRPGALIYLSLGSLGSADVELMQRLVDVLGRTEHRVIVSKGPLADQIRLHDNMTGESFLPQPAILPLVDLVITHGGNNTVVESFHNGKPMIVLPLFWDQVDNAQRVHETGFGRRLSTYGFADEELTGAIDALLADAALRERMAGIAARMQADRGTERAADLIERLADDARAGAARRPDVPRPVPAWHVDVPNAGDACGGRHLKPRTGAAPRSARGGLAHVRAQYQAPETPLIRYLPDGATHPRNLGCDHPEPTSGAEPPRSADEEQTDDVTRAPHLLRAAVHDARGVCDTSTQSTAPGSRRSRRRSPPPSWSSSGSPPKPPTRPRRTPPPSTQPPRLTPDDPLRR